MTSNQLEEEVPVVASEVTFHDDIKAFIEAASAEPHGDIEELAFDDLEGSEEGPELEAGAIWHVLRCRQGLGNAYVYSDSWFRPPATCEMWTRTAFYNAGGVRLLLTAWRYKGGGNPLATYYNRWTWKSTQVARGLAIWRAAVSDGGGGYSYITDSSRWASCS